MQKSERLPRLLHMIIVLQSHPGLSAEELAKRCWVSLRTCFRDLSVLQEAGVPLYNDHGYRLATNTMMKTIQFTLEETVSLIYGLKLIDRQKGLVCSSQSLKDKLLSLLPESLIQRIEEIDTKVEVASQPGVDYSKKMEWFKLINLAITGNKRLQIVYYTLSRDQVSGRKVDPYKLAFKDGFWYLVGYCYLREQVLLFRVDRIRELQILEESFTLPEHFNFEAYMGAAWQMERGEEFIFKVRFLGDAVRFVRETRFHESQQLTEESDGVLIYQAKACGIKSVARWVLSFGAEAEILEPTELREYVATQVRRMAAGYRLKVES